MRRWFNKHYTEQSHTRKAMAWSVLLMIGSLSFSWISELTHPLQLLVTYVHEFCHAFVTLLTGGEVLGMEINSNTSGKLALFGGWPLWITSAGYPGTVLVGLFCFRLLDSPYGAHKVLWLMIAVLCVSLYYCIDRSFYGSFWAVVIGGALLAIVFKTSTRTIEITAAVMTMQLMLGAFYDMKVLFSLYSTAINDALIMETSTGIPAIAWAYVWLGLSIYVTVRMLRTWMRHAKCSLSAA